MTGDRRSPYHVPHDGPAELPCRVCFAYVHLAPANIFRAGEYDDAYWAFRCPSCGGSFPIRGADVPAMLRAGHPAGSARARA